MSQQKPLIPMPTGERLKHRREKLGHGLADVAQELHIDETVLRALEDDRVDHMAHLYRRGYIRNYARFLGFRTEEIEEMLNEIGNEQPALHTVFPEAGNPRQAERWIKATSYVLASLLVGTLAWQFTHEAVRLSQQRGGADAELANQGPTDADGAAQTRAGSGHVNASIAALEKLPRQQRPSATAATGVDAWNAIQRTAPGAASGSTLELSASGDSWVEITDADGKQLEMDLVRGGSSKQYQGRAPFNIQFGRASAVSLEHNGVAIDIAPYTRGDVTQMLLNADGSAEAVVPGAKPGE
ncbi:MAG: DUF4115 domain-containing protein [Xanthomonadales bacterium]|nr:DUF4115 domain-containing protein [Xanthomonadales bacterium]